ncbi:GNAT family N-acetyltransferase [Sphingomonas solaris]|uniref:GNAT family N-acetyltransferase n=1 Tax=Alterirhizorhabdus solaris TaxID=2529389 RepID=A0A558RCQ7_9SPHN|nr:GNAT family N-acetyltransferase [Sphingomonas solaris]TVV77229.1 GNAT family N-acetyltransferase [Sphingomonas solaris]
MAEDGEADELRAMASHRGFRLVRSRRRTPGVGDYGRYGLADPATGKPLFGIADDGALTATAGEVADHLRGSVAAGWRESADATPDPPKRPAGKRPPDSRSLAVSKPAAALPAGERDRGDTRPSAPEPAPAPKRRRAARPEHPPKPAAPPPEPVLAIRHATRADAPAIAALLGMSSAAIERHIAAQARARAPLLVADRGGVAGCLGWHPIPLPDGAIGRLVTLVVAERSRRQGIGRALVESAIAAITARGCRAIEAMSDIEVRNVHGFFRATGFTQTSYRFALDIPSPRRKQSTA